MNNYKIYCKCGCGEKLLKYKNYRSRKFIFGHQNRGKFHANILGNKHPMYGKKHSEKSKKQMSDSRNNYLNTGGITPIKGKTHSDETKTKMKLCKKEFYKNGGINHFKGKHHSEESNEKNRVSQYNRSVTNDRFKNTKPERFMQSVLSVNGVKYETHKKLYGRPDIFIEPNICIFIDGCYWHGCNKYMSESQQNQKTPLKKKIIDRRVNKELKYNGYEIIRIWEHEINYNLYNAYLKLNELAKGDTNDEKTN